MSNFEFQLFDPIQRKLPFQPRNGETRTGELLTNKKLHEAKFVIIGVSENAGPQANLGRPGSENAFNAFSKVFYNTQVYEGAPVHDTAFLGQIKQLKDPQDRPQAMEMVKELDALLFAVLKQHILPGQIPIVVGGGHNNALPLMRWAAMHDKLSVVNIDAHADLRPTDKRHSGNSFAFALQEQLLEAYGVFGLHEAFNNAYIRMQLTDSRITHRFFEDYLQGPHQVHDDLCSFIQHQTNPIGLEIDMDAIALMPSSAFSPSGWTLDQMRSFIFKIGHLRPKIAYLNLTEAAPQDDKEDLVVGKALAYLVRDFCRSFA
ncbi:MAG: arginase family protein [Flavobacteriales bacterium]